MTGDSNVAVDPILDKPQGLNTNILQSPTIGWWNYCFNSFLCIFGEKKIIYTISPTHKQCSRIDHVFVPSSLISDVSCAQIHLISWSDHDPVVIYLVGSDPRANQFHCWLKESFLNKEMLYKEILLYIKEFLCTNFPEDSSLVIKPIVDAI